MKFKELLKDYEKDNISFKNTLIYIHEKGKDKAFQKLTKYNFDFSYYLYFKLPKQLPKEKILDYLNFLTIFNFDFKNLTLYEVICENNKEIGYFLLDFLLEKNILNVDFHADDGLDLCALGCLNLTYFKKIIAYFNLDLQGLYGEYQISLYYYAKTEELIDYLYQNGADIYHDLKKYSINEEQLLNIVFKIDLSKLKKEIIYRILYYLDNIDIKKGKPEKWEMAYNNLIEYLLTFEKQDLSDHSKILDLIYPIIDIKLLIKKSNEQDSSYHSSNLELLDTFPNIKLLIKRFVEEGIELNKVLIDFVKMCPEFIKDFYPLLKDVYEFNLEYAKIDLEKMREKLMPFKNSPFYKREHITRLYHLCYILYKYKNVYIEEYLNWLVNYFYTFNKKEEEKIDMDIEKIQENIKLDIINGFEKGLIPEIIDNMLGMED